MPRWMWWCAWPEPDGVGKSFQFGWGCQLLTDSLGVFFLVFFLLREKEKCFVRNVDQA